MHVFFSAIIFVFCVVFIGSYFTSLIYHIACFLEDQPYRVIDENMWDKIKPNIKILIIATLPIWLIFRVLHIMLKYFLISMKGLFDVMHAIITRDITKVFIKDDD